MSSEQIAYEFEANKSWAELINALDLNGPWKWHERQSADAEDYLATSAASGEDWSVTVTIYCKTVDAAYIAKVRRRYFGSGAKEAEAKEAYAAATRILLHKILPALGARSIVETSPPESVQPFET